ncbi:MAG: murein L,D-transpeptidase [Steroidobacterales bacterium]
MRAWFVAALLAVLAAAAWPMVAMPAMPAPADTLAEPDAMRAALAGSTPREMPPAVRRRSIESVRAQLVQLYGRRGEALLWSRELSPTPEALSLVRILATADARGLIPEDYQADTLARMLQSLQQGSAGLDQRAQFDLRLSLAALAFVTDLHRGRIDPRAAGFELPEDPSGFDATTILEQLAARADAATVLDQIAPQYIHYQLLEQALARFRQLALEPDLTRLPPLPAAKVVAGGHYAGAAALRRLLSALDCLPVPTFAADPFALDGELVAGLKRFQALYGLQVDGTLGRTTYAALTIPLAQRVRQIELTLERWRWLPPLQAPSVIVNIPEYRLFAPTAGQDREDEMLRMDVIVGRQYPRTRTPVFGADMKYVVFRPYWDVPRSILVHEILPLLAKNPHYLEAQDMEIVRGESDEATVLPTTPDNIQALAAGRLRLRQRPGASNALGLIKFMLPNAHNVYLHSTPVPRLFEQARRTFSHGCIRISDPVALAEQVLKSTPGDWTREKIVSQMNGSETLHVTLATPVQVLIVYGTAIASEDGAVHFFDDIYRYDRRLESLLGLVPVSGRP